MIRLAVCDDDKLYIEHTLKPLLCRAEKISDTAVEISFFTDGNRLLEEYKKQKTTI